MDGLISLTLIVFVLIVLYLVFQKTVSSEWFYTWSIIYSQKQRKKTETKELQKYRNTHSSDELKKLVEELYTGKEVKIKWEAFVGRYGSELLDNLEDEIKVKTDYSAVRFLIENLHRFKTLIDGDGYLTLAMDIDPSLEQESLYVVSKSNKIVYTNKLPSKKEDVIIDTEVINKIIHKDEDDTDLSDEDSEDLEQPTYDSYCDIRIANNNVEIIDMIDESIYMEDRQGNKYIVEGGTSYTIKATEKENQEVQNNNNESNQNSNQDSEQKNLPVPVVIDEQNQNENTNAQENKKEEIQQEEISTEVQTKEQQEKDIAKKLDQGNKKELVINIKEIYNSNEPTVFTNNDEDEGEDENMDFLEGIDEVSNNANKDSGKQTHIEKNELDTESSFSDTKMFSFKSKLSFLDHDAFIKGINRELVDFIFGQLIEVSIILQKEKNLCCMVKDKETENYYIDVVYFGQGIAQMFENKDDKLNFLQYFLNGTNSLKISQARVANFILAFKQGVTKTFVTWKNQENEDMFLKTIYFQHNFQWYKSSCLIIDKKSFYEYDKNIISKIAEVAIVNKPDAKELVYTGKEILKIFDEV